MKYFFIELFRPRFLFALLFVVLLSVGYKLKCTGSSMPSWLRADTNNTTVKNDLQSNNGAGVEMRNWIGQTGLMYSVILADLDRFRLLLHYGADPNARSSQSPREEDPSFNNTALHYAVRHTTGQTRLVNTTIIEELVDAGADVNAQNSLGETALMWSLNIPLFEDRKEVVKLFISDMADVNLQNNIGETYLMLSIKATDRGWLQYVVETYGSMFDYNLKNRDGLDAIAYAKAYVHERYIDIVKNRKVVGLGDRVHERDILGRTGLMLAIIRNDYIFAERQLLYHADVQAADATRFKNTPLHFALMRHTNMVPFITLLLNNGAQANIQNHYGDTPLHYLVRYNFASVQRDQAAEIMIRAGADPSVKNYRGRSVIDEARRKDPSFAKRLEDWAEANKKTTK